ncbi:tetratricopeptide repeat protein [Cloacibacterium normanense]|uniref:Tetratricopeptide repeat family protein n=1 Tax=Cloacibacterium normanense TaxID=237258 RepID=A0A1E5UGZ7_9FLAO|nr:tetratricopeptide repeat protein [Cloacibacterium normanense]AZI69709.1 tetratricopeptide repeat protein [Cloacibacterium normanense]OEL12172.1 tetratricopeptide repeat family protein [Cloacibacterium normanense]SDO53730.1 Tetratricopeptide repeat-containing protein [Cloacibacterium normanense]
MLRKFFVHISLFFLGLIAVKAQESLNTLIFRGNRSFDKQKYGEATSTFSEAVKKNEKDFGAHYNLGNSLYKIKKYDEAIAEYQKAQKITNNKDEKAASYYNEGNAHLQNGDGEKAVNAYKNALKFDPDNEAILKNLQIAKKKQKQKDNKQNQQNQQQNQQNNQNKNQDNNQNQQGDQNHENKNNNTKNQPNGNIGDQNKGKGNQGAEKQNQKNEPQNPNDQNKIPKDLQKLILQRSANQERETAKKLLNKNGYYSPESNTKDW